MRLNIVALNNSRKNRIIHHMYNNAVGQTFQKMARFNGLKIFCFFSILLLLLGAPACVSPARHKEIIFLPPPPAKPRLQLLLTFGSESDLGGKSRIPLALLGKKEKERSLGKPYGVAIQQQKLFITDTLQGSVVIVDLAKKKFEPLPGDEGMGKLRVPINLTFDNQGNLYVTDTGRSQVLVYNPQGRHLRTLGDGTAFKPSGIAIQGERIYVSDIKNHRILVIDRRSGKELHRFGGVGREKGKLSFPTNLALDIDSNVYVSEAFTGRVQKFSPDGKFLLQFGELGTSLGNLVRPKGVAVDRRRNLYVVDAASEHAQIFDKQGRLLLFFGGNRGTPDSLYLPAGMCISYDPETLKALRPYVASGYDLEYVIAIINQYGKNKVSLFGFLR